MRRNSGFTLIELIVFVVIVSVGIAGILLPIMTTVRNSPDPVIARQLVLIADSLMDEIMAKDEIIGTDPSTARPEFDGVMDYNGYASTGIRTIDDTPIPGLSEYSVAVTVTPAVLANVEADHAVRIQITVTRGDNRFVLEGYRLAYELADE